MNTRIRVATVSTTVLAILAVVAVLAVCRPWTRKQTLPAGTWNVVGEQGRPAIRAITFTGQQESPTIGVIDLASSTTYDIALPLDLLQRVDDTGIVLTMLVPVPLARHWGFHAASEPVLVYGYFELRTSKTARWYWLPPPPKGVPFKFRGVGNLQPAAHLVKASK